MNLNQLFEDLGKLVVLFAGFLLCITALLYFLNIDMSSVNVLLAFLITLIVQYIYYKRNRKHPIKSLLISTGLFLSIFILSLLISWKFYDLSWDGQAYQQEAIIQLKQGWNPFLDSPLSDNVNRAIWINHYAKSPWLIAAPIYHLTNHIEMAKAFNLLFIIAVLLISFAIIYPRFKKITPSLLISGLLAFNPISFYQMFSFYVDGLLSSLIILFILSVLLYLRNENDRKFNLIFIAANIALIANIKFTALVYIVILSFGFFLYVIFKQKEKTKEVFLTLLLTFLFSVLVIGFNPYITNTLKNGHPFYPLSGKNAVDIITINMDKNFVEENNRFVKFGLSMFSPSDNSRTYPVMKNPLTMTNNEIFQFSGPDVRIGGFGPLSGLILILSVCAFIYLLFLMKGTKRSILLFFLFWIFVSIFINPEPWWARYIPQLWIIPVLLVFCMLSVNKTIIANMVTYGFIIILVLNLAITDGLNLISSYVYSHITSQQLKVVSEISKDKPVKVTFGAFASNRVRLKESNVSYTEEKDLSCNYSTTFIDSYLKVCVNTQEEANKLNNILAKRNILERYNR